jgi:hypothetical protein
MDFHNAEVWLAIIAVITALISALAAIWVGAVKVGQLELKVNTLWDFLLRRAESELVTRGLGTQKLKQRDSE